MKIFPAILLLLLIILVCGCTSSSSKADPKLIDQGIKLYNEGKYQDALWSFERYLINDETSSMAATAWAWKGISYEELSNYEQALYCYNRAIAIQREIPQLWRSKERVLEKLGRHEEAREAAKKATELEAKQSSGYPTISPTISPTTSNNQTEPQPTPPQFSQKDYDYIAMTASQTKILSEITSGITNLSVFQYRTYGSHFKSTVDDFLTEAKATSPDNLLLRKSWESYMDALRFYSLAGQWEEIAGKGFESGNYSAGNEAMEIVAQNIEQGNSNLTLMEKFIDDSGILNFLK